MRIYTWDAAAGEETIYPGFGPATQIVAAGANAASFPYDAASAFSADVQAGDTLVAVAETRQGQFSWAGGQNYVYFDKHVITNPEFVSATAIFSSGNQQLIPAPTLVTFTSTSVTLQWTGLVDPSGAISSYSVYRGTGVVPPVTTGYPVTNLLPQTAAQSGTVNFTDTGAAASTTYHYTIAPNFKWSGGPNIGLGANTNKPYYTTFGQSLTLTVTTPANPPSLTAQWFVPTGASLGQIFTVRFSLSNTGDLPTSGNVTPTADPVLLLGGSASLVGSATPAPAVMNGHTTRVYTYTYSATGAGTVNFSATATDGASVTVSAQSVNVSLASAAALSSSTSVSGPMVYVAPNATNPTNLTVYLTVTNTGGSIAINVTPLAAPVLSPAPPPFIFGLTSGPVSSLNITPGASAVFTWTYSTFGSGRANFQVQVQGVDQNSAGPIFSTATASSNVIAVRPQMALLVASTHSSGLRTYSLGEPLTLTVDVTNNDGGLAALDVSATVDVNLPRYGTVNSGSPSMLLQTVPAALASLAPSGSTATFTFSFSAAAAGRFAPGAHAQASTTANTYFADPGPYDGGVAGPTLTFVNPANLTLSAFTVSATQVTEGQRITVVMTVADVGGATATAVTPQLFPNVISGGVVFLTSSASAVSIPGATFGTGPFATRSFTWTYSANASGSVFFTGSASGNDGNWESHGLTATVSTGSGTTPTINIFKPASLALSVDPITPNSVTSGQIFSLVLSVSNSTGGATATQLSPNVSVNPSPSFNVHKISNPAPIFLTLVAGATAKFTWTYSFTGVTGTASLSFTATALDSVSSLTVTGVSAPFNIQHQLPASLSSTLFSTSSVASVGNLFTLYLSVTNTGGASALVLPATLSISPGGPSAVIYSPPTAASLAGGASKVFTYTYSGVGTGVFTFSGNALGTDQNTNTPISSSGNGISISLVNPVLLDANFDPGTPTLVSTGQIVTLRMNVNNLAAIPGATAIAAHPLALNQVSGGGGSFAFGSGPVPATQDIIATGTYQFTFTYTATNPGTVAFNGLASAIDQNTGLTQSSSVISYPTITIQSSAALASSLSISPGLLTPSGTLFAYLTVTNTGGSGIAGVFPSLTFSPAILTQISPAFTGVSLVPGASTVFTWAFSPTGTGTLNFTVNVSGQDSVSGLTKSATAKLGSAIVRTPTNLASALAFMPLTASTTQPLTLIMTVSNTGESDAVGVAPVLQFASTFFGKYGTANPVVLSSGPTPASQGIPGLSSRPFTFIYSANGAGSVAFSGGAAGTDSILGTQVLSVENISNFIDIQNIAVLSSALSASPTAVNLGSEITVRMTVTNTGGANAVTVKPATPLVGLGTAGALFLAGPSPASAALSPGASAVFTFRYSATGLGSISFSGRATGTDQNSGFLIQSPYTVSNETAVRNDPLLSASLSMFPGSVNVNQRVTVGGIL